VQREAVAITRHGGRQRSSYLAHRYGGISSTPAAGLRPSQVLRNGAVERHRHHLSPSGI
jgi:hypothetical protein